MTSEVLENIKKIAYDFRHWYHIEKNTSREQKYDSTNEADLFKIHSSKIDNSFMEQFKKTIFDLHDPAANYIIGKTNLS